MLHRIGTWGWAIAALAVVRVAIPLAVLAGSGDKLPGLPRYEYTGLSGDATGFYAAAREFIASVPRLGTPLFALLGLVVLGLWAALTCQWRRGRLAGHWALVLAVGAAIVLVAIVITKMSPPGAAVFGWPLIWSIPMFPLRALHLLGEDVAFGIGVPISIAANVVTVVATAHIGLRVTGRRWVGLAGAAIFAFWPLLMGAVAGARGWENGTWTADAGLAMYTEPLSTALVTSALALLLSPRLTPLRLSLAGLAFGLGTLVKLSNGILAAVVVLVLARRAGVRRALPFLAGGLIFAPAVIAYWQRGYPAIRGDMAARPKFVSSLSGVADNWRDSLLFSPRTLLVLVPLAVVGALAVRSRYALALLVLPVLVNAGLYSFYTYTDQHPRFLFVSLPPVFVLWAAGAGTLALGVRKVWRERRGGATIMSGQ